LSMAPSHVLAELHGGPLDGDVVQAAVREDGSLLLTDAIAVPVPVLDERSETFWWDTARYVPTGTSIQLGSQLRWHFAYASTSPR
jgi:hypothetical protein